MATVYALKNTLTGAAYIGCTRSSPKKRWREHKSLLKSKKHTCKGLQLDWDRYGEGAFQIVSLEDCSDDLESRRSAELRQMEQADLLYNEEKISFRPSEAARQKGVNASRFVEGRKRSPEANLKRSLAQKGKPKGHGAKISATKRANRSKQVMR